MENYLFTNQYNQSVSKIIPNVNFRRSYCCLGDYKFTLWCLEVEIFPL